MTCLIHHWDADGIASAAIVAERLEKEGRSWKNLSPEIGEFKLPLSRVESREIYVVDLNIPEEISAVAKEFERVYFFDHHLQDKIANSNVVHVNPNLENLNYPSTSWVVSDHFDAWSHLSALGAVGDLGERAFKIPRVLELLELSEEQTIELVRLIDSNYIAMDIDGVEEAVGLLLKNSPEELLEHRRWRKNLERVEREVERIIPLWNGEEIFFSSSMNVISIVAKRIAWKEGRNVLAVNSNFNGRAQVYLRIAEPKPDVRGLISLLKQSSFNVGGKPEVLGIVCEKKELERVLEIIWRFLGRYK
jgi:single-stranded DNA-specific DHH superfamily exonuclease